MEDLVVRDYKMLSRHIGLNMRQMEKCLEKMARYHAASAVIHERSGKFDNQFDEGFYSNEMKLLLRGPINELMLGTIIKHVASWPFGKRYADKMRKWPTGAVFDAMTVCFKQDETGFIVLNHGDMWINNSMYKYDEDGELEDCIFVDFQMSFWGSPIIDLQYFILSSAEKKIRIRGMDHFIAHYHQHLVANLDKLHFRGKVPTLKELHIDILKHGVFREFTRAFIKLL